MRIVVVTPTYNEAQNLPILAEKIFALKIPDLELVIVDDNSPDGTGKIADELAKKYASASSAQAPIRVIHRSGKQGLGTAYIAAFKEILARQNGLELIIQIDADLSHDPAAIPAMLEKIKNCDLVLGSRYIPGGNTENWELIRKLVSRFGNLYARAVLWLPYRDLTGGFKCFRRQILENIDLNSISSAGYNFQIEMTYRAHQKKFRIQELPIIFTERKTGKSKFNLMIMLEAFWKVLLLRLRGR